MTLIDWITIAVVLVFTAPLLLAHPVKDWKGPQ